MKHPAPAARFDPAETLLIAGLAAAVGLCPGGPRRHHPAPLPRRPAGQGPDDVDAGEGVPRVGADEGVRVPAAHGLEEAVQRAHVLRDGREEREGPAAPGGGRPAPLEEPAEGKGSRAADAGAALGRDTHGLLVHLARVPGELGADLHGEDAREAPDDVPRVRRERGPQEGDGLPKARQRRRAEVAPVRQRERRDLSQRIAATDAS